MAGEACGPLRRHLDWRGKNYPRKTKKAVTSVDLRGFTREVFLGDQGYYTVAFTWAYLLTFRINFKRFFNFKRLKTQKTHFILYIDSPPPFLQRTLRVLRQHFCRSAATFTDRDGSWNGSDPLQGELCDTLERRTSRRTEWPALNIP